MTNTLDAALATLVATAQASVVQIRSGQRGAGSGIIWRRDGLLITNHHVIAGQREVSVETNASQTLAAEVIASDPVLDLAILQVSADDLPAAVIGNSQSVRVGELVLAIGHPWGIRNVTTMGIISGTGTISTPWRSAQTEYLRSDVRLAPGNSGGPLLNAHGEVIGINAMIFGGDLSVAIPAHIAEQFIAVSTNAAPQLGVTLQQVLVGPSRRQAQPALLVTDVVPDSVAAHAGLLVGDVLLAANDQPLAEPHALRWAVFNHDRQRPLPLRIQRGTQATTLNVAFDLLQPDVA